MAAMLVPPMRGLPPGATAPDTSEALRREVGAIL
jgi:hypothetical protein